jgi:hypothetical protein
VSTVTLADAPDAPKSVIAEAITEASAPGAVGRSKNGLFEKLVSTWSFSPGLAWEFSPATPRHQAHFEAPFYYLNGIP